MEIPDNIFNDEELKLEQDDDTGIAGINDNNIAFSYHHEFEKLNFTDMQSQAKKSRRKRTTLFIKPFE